VVRIYLGSDHRGFELKEEILKWLRDEGYEVEEVGAYVFDPDDDYVDYAVKAAEMVEGGKEGDRAILLCGSGHGMEMVANRFPHVRAVLGFNDEVTRQGREDEDANVLVLPADWVSYKEACARGEIFLVTEASEEARHKRRREKITDLEIRR